jgi:hypothetical protein
MEDGLRRDLRFGLGVLLCGVGGPTVLGFGIAASTNHDLRLWTNPWFIVAIVLTVAGIILISLAGLHRKSEAVPTLPASSGPANRLPSVVPVSPIWKRGEGFSNWQAGHEILGGGVLLWIRSTDTSELGLVTCRVQDPDGYVYGNHFQISEWGHSTKQGRWEFFYPRDFTDAPDEAVSGRHSVKWTVGVNDSLVARDEFDIPT